MGNLLLESWEAAQLTQLSPHLKQVQLAALTVLQEAHAPWESIYFPVNALISVQQPLEDCAFAEIGVIGCDGFTGLPLVEQERMPRSAPFRLIVQSAGQAWCLPADCLHPLLQPEEPLRREAALYKQFWCQQLALTLLSQRRNLTAHLAYWLLQRLDTPGTAPLLSLSQEQIANLLGVRREAVNRVMKAKQQQGLINYRRSQLQVLNRDGLMALAGEPAQQLAQEKAAYATSLKLPEASAAVATRKGLRRNAQRLQAALEAGRIMWWERDLVSAELLYPADYVQELLGWTDRVLKEAQLTERVHPQDREEWLAARHAYLRGQRQNYQVEYRLRHAAGHWIWVQSRGRIDNRAADGTPLSVVGTLMDINARRLAESAVRASEERMQSMLGLSADWLWEQDAQARFTAWEPAKLGAAPFKPYSAIGRTRRELTNISFETEFLDTLDAIFEKREAFKNLIHLRNHADGTRSFAAISGEPLFDETEEFTGYRGTGRDVTTTELQREQLAVREQQLSTIAKYNLDALCLLDQEGRFVFVSDQYSRWVNQPVSNIIGRKPQEILEPEVWAQWEPLFSRIWQGETIRHTNITPHPDGPGHLAQITLNPIRTEDGQVQGIVVSFADISALHQAQQRQSDAEKLFKNIFKLTALGMSQMSLDGHLLQVNHKYCEMLGYTEEEMLKTTWMALTHPDDHASSWRMGETILAGLKESGQVDTRVMHRDGHTFWLQVTMTLVRGNQQEPLYWMSVNEDISKRKETELTLAQRGNTDALTGAQSRRRTIELAHEELLRSQRYGVPLSLLLLDLDHFKRINDSHGHAAGDQVLIDFANIVRGLLRDVDVLGRWGGEEFVVLLPQTTLDGALALAGRINGLIADSAVVWANTIIRYTVSIGVAHIERGDPELKLRPDLSLDTLLDCADKALYQAKQGGRNQAVAWQEPTAKKPG